ncbi:hypothetical protein PF008_g31939 [Phytophthora fragariae]|uniref:RxLR effector protein n=1 Tax=Phytophthora fragariae TaxID=53985 RepID=A0A6G0Q1R3_9STRA|nr:hypothetical protein PF008_g31939 [Phytophthora fragariae]
MIKKTRLLIINSTALLLFLVKMNADIENNTPNNNSADVVGAIVFCLCSQIVFIILPDCVRVPVRHSVRCHELAETLLYYNTARNYRSGT